MFMDEEIRKLRRPLILLLVLLLTTTVGYYVLLRTMNRDVSLLECVYMVVITMSTVGYEDALNVKSHPLLIVCTVVMILCYMIVVAYIISSFTAFLVEGRLKRYFSYRIQRKRISKMNEQVLVCGVRDVGRYVAHELHETNRPFVVIENHRPTLERIEIEIPGLVHLEGDPTDDDVLRQAGIERAAALVAALPDDKDNLYLVLAARECNPRLRIGAAFHEPKARKKLLHAGASFLVSPHMIGGLRIASELIRPQVVSFLDRMLRTGKEKGVRIEEVTVPEGSPWVGRPLADLWQHTGVLVIAALPDGQSDYAYNPDPRRTIEARETLIFIAGPEKRRLLQDTLLTSD